MATPGYLASFSNGSAGQSARRWSSHRPKRFASGPVAASKQGSLTSPRLFQRLARVKPSSGCDDTILSRSNAPKVVAVRPSQNRSLPPLHTSHMLRPLISSGVSATPLSMSWNQSSSAWWKDSAVRPACMASSCTWPGLGPDWQAVMKATVNTAARPVAAQVQRVRDCLDMSSLSGLDSSARAGLPALRGRGKRL